MKFDLTVEEKAVEMPVRLAMSCTCWTVAARLAYNLVPLMIIFVVGWMVMQTAKEDAGLVAVGCVDMRDSRLSRSWKDQTVVLDVGLMEGWLLWSE